MCSQCGSTDHLFRACPERKHTYAGLLRASLGGVHNQGNLKERGVPPCAAAVAVQAASTSGALIVPVSAQPADGASEGPVVPGGLPQKSAPGLLDIPCPAPVLALLPAQGLSDGPTPDPGPGSATTLEPFSLSGFTSDPDLAEVIPGSTPIPGPVPVPVPVVAAVPGSAAPDPGSGSWLAASSGFVYIFGPRALAASVEAAPVAQSALVSASAPDGSQELFSPLAELILPDLSMSSEGAALLTSVDLETPLSWVDCLPSEEGSVAEWAKVSVRKRSLSGDSDPHKLLKAGHQVSLENRYSVLAVSSGGDPSGDVGVEISVVVFGKGYWKLNTGLVLEQDFKTQFINLYKGWVGLQPYFNSLVDWWEGVKVRVGVFARKYCRWKGRRELCTFREVRHQLQKLYGEWNKGAELNTGEVERLMLWQRRWCEARAKTFRFKAQKIAFEQDERCSAFFFKSVKVASAKAVIPGLRGEDGVLRTEGRGMLEVATAFYRRLFSEQKVDGGMGDFFLKFLKARVPEAVRAVLELPISLEELTAALKGMKERKVPGRDGIPKEFYKEFWHVLGPDFLRVINSVFLSGELSPTMKEGVVSLLFKKGDPEVLGNWRPLTLLGVDYKLIARVLTARLGMAMPHVVHEDQTCGVEGRSVFFNLQLVRDVVSWVQDRGLPLALVSLDQEKAFYRIRVSCFDSGPQATLWGAQSEDGACETYWSGQEVWAEAQVHFMVLQGLTVKGVLLGEGWQRMRFKDWVLVLLVLSLIKKGLWDAQCASVQSNVEVGVKGIMGCVRAELRWRFWVEERKWGYHAAKEKWKLVLAGLP
ncbi:hypothetical protein SKAU_G00238420 [Synaphobranchus kaupii]|uniref:Reverse transcriptase domain-containing protein n=1 Tax=Synaphobranchus kaupii TaxID=118154 RepID=A0A9Q1F736_SYNKA|nr:hypothetical protein SKAU_G00238420 [Synaphobranchus kaupii]